MNSMELAKAITGNNYGEEISDELIKEAKASNLIVMYGRSDDCIEIVGAVNDEAYGPVCFNEQGVVSNKCEMDECPYWQEEMKGSASVEPSFGMPHPDGFSWVFKTDIPHEKFTILEGDEKFCEGIVFSLYLLKEGYRGAQI